MSARNLWVNSTWVTLSDLIYVEGIVHFMLPIVPLFFRLRYRHALRVIMPVIDAVVIYDLMVFGHEDFHLDLDTGRNWLF